MQEQIPSAFRSGACEKYEDDRGSSLLSAEVRKTSEDVRKSYELLCKMFSAVPERTKEELEPILGKKLMGYASGKFSDFERQKQKGSTAIDYNAVDENDEIHRVMMEVELLLEASGKCNWRSIMLTHDEFPCHCLLQTWWYPGRTKSGVDLGLWRAALHGFTRFITAHHDSDSGSYGGDTMAGSSCEREQSRRNAYERAIAGIGLSKRFKSF